jgi:hypothetical protein
MVSRVDGMDSGAGTIVTGSDSLSPVPGDRSGWGAELRFESLGVRFAIRVPGPRVLADLAPYFPPGWAPLPAGAVDVTYTVRAAGDSVSAYGLYRDSAVVLRSARLTAVVDRFASDIHHQVAVLNTGRVFIHAGVVGWRERAILFPGRSHAGKSRLIEALVSAGAAYFSDEWAIVGEDALIHPYPKPIAHRVAPGVPRGWRSPEALGGVAGSSPLPAGLIAFLRYDPGAGWNVRELTPAQAVLKLLDNTVGIRTQGGFALSLVSRAAQGAAAVTGTRGEAAEATERLLALLERQVTQPTRPAGR